MERNGLRSHIPSRIHHQIGVLCMLHEEAFFEPCPLGQMYTYLFIFDCASARRLRRPALSPTLTWVAFPDGPVPLDLHGHYHQSKFEPQGNYQFDVTTALLRTRSNPPRILLGFTPSEWAIALAIPPRADQFDLGAWLAAEPGTVIDIQEAGDSPAFDHDYMELFPRVGRY